MPHSLPRTESSNPLQITSSARTHVGAVRTINEDRILDCPECRLWAVADGMGGHSLGDAAAATVIKALAAIDQPLQPVNEHLIAEALERANQEIYRSTRITGRTSGTTVAGLHIQGSSALIFWAGDSRIYRLRARNLERLTRDHSLVQELTDAGVLTVEQARDHPKANVITRALGVQAFADVEFGTHSVADGDLYLVCTDGLCGLLEDAAICALLSSSPSIIVDQLIHAALAAGGTDNVSVIVISVTI
jgi:serine/threonine protein phosphatase PrpC